MEGSEVALSLIEHINRAIYMDKKVQVTIVKATFNLQLDNLGLTNPNAWLVVMIMLYSINLKARIPVPYPTISHQFTKDFIKQDVAPHQRMSPAYLWLLLVFGHQNAS